MEVNKVVQALKVLQEAGREDLIKDGVLEQAWVGLRRPKRSSSDRVSAAVLACKFSAASPKKCRKFKSKSVAGRKVLISPDYEREESRVSSVGGLPGVSAVRRGAARFARRSGSSFQQRVAAAGRGAVVTSAVGGVGKPLGRGSRARSWAGGRRPQAAMSTCGQMGESVARARTRFSKGARAHKDLVPQAPLTLESGGEHGNAPFEERRLGGAANMAAPSDLRDLAVDKDIFKKGEGGHRFMAEQASTGIIIIDSEEESEVLELQFEGEHQRFGRPAGGPLAVGVRAPPGRRLEERAQSGAVCLTAREVTPLEVRSLETSARGLEPRSDSGSAILGDDEEEELDYGDDGDQVAVPQASSSGQAFQGERLSRREIAANLTTGEGFDTGTGGLAIGGVRSGVRALKNVDVEIQAGGEGKKSKVGDSLSTVQEVTGPDQLGCREEAL
ncbi:hypothetical protein NDU88_005722 [Pleurodeles waltl]|uniref:Uncharacterized protein n=1 Tax=Pleurodeles waltl TaxID=8319 RepID=A0AAV7MA74_PLEWA|nr:hypothetical protein NDU88_005722 [Pleurodeles waltl]